LESQKSFTILGFIDSSKVSKLLTAMLFHGKCANFVRS
jgi:hypothetical protein